MELLHVSLEVEVIKLFLRPLDVIVMEAECGDDLQVLSPDYEKVRGEPFCLHSAPVFHDLVQKLRDILRLKAETCPGLQIHDEGEESTVSL